MGRVVHGGAAGVPADVAVLHGDKGLFLVGERVAEEELAEGDGVGGGGVGLGGQPRVAVGGVGGSAAWWAEGAGSGEGHGVALLCVALAGCLGLVSGTSAFGELDGSLLAFIIIFLIALDWFLRFWCIEIIVLLCVIFGSALFVIIFYGCRLH